MTYRRLETTYGFVIHSVWPSRRRDHDGFGCYRRLGQLRHDEWYCATVQQAADAVEARGFEVRESDYCDMEISQEQSAFEREVNAEVDRLRDEAGDDPLSRCEAFIRRARALAQIVAGGLYADNVALARIAATFEPVAWPDGMRIPSVPPDELLVDDLVAAPGAPQFTG